MNISQRTFSTHTDFSNGISTFDNNFANSNSVTDSFVLQNEIMTNFSRMYNERQETQNGYQTNTEQYNNSNSPASYGWGSSDNNTGIKVSSDANDAIVAGADPVRDGPIGGIPTGAPPVEEEEGLEGSGGIFQGSEVLSTLGEGASSMGSMFAGSVLASANSSLMGGAASSMANSTRMGMGPSQHNVLQETTAQMQQSTMNTYSGIAAATMAAGSLFGPEGLALGALAGAAIDAVGYGVASDQDAMVNTTGGDMIPS